VSLLGSRYAQLELSRLRRRRRGTRKVAARREDFVISMIAVVSCRVAFTRRSRQLHARNNGEAGALATYASILELLDGVISPIDFNTSSRNPSRQKSWGLKDAARL